MFPGPSFEAQQLLNDMQAEADATKRLYDGEQALMDNRPAAEAPGVDISAIKAIDPSFDDQQFLSLARESFYTIRKARTLDNPALADGELSPQLMSQLREVVQGDVASHRHHLLPGLEIRAALIESACVADGKITVVVRFHLVSEEVDRGATGAIIAGDFSQREWDEDWTFWRDPSVASSSVDREHMISPVNREGWLFAHRGWVVTHIERLGAPDPLGSSNL